jgi:hypothetical protein
VFETVVLGGELVCVVLGVVREVGVPYQRVDG